MSQNGVKSVLNNPNNLPQIVLPSDNLSRHALDRLHERFPDDLLAGKIDKTVKNGAMFLRTHTERKHAGMHIVRFNHKYNAIVTRNPVDGRIISFLWKAEPSYLPVDAIRIHSKEAVYRVIRRIDLDLLQNPKHPIILSDGRILWFSNGKPVGSFHPYSHKLTNSLTKKQQK